MKNNRSVRRFLFVLLFTIPVLIFISVSASADSQGKILTTYSLERLNGAANLLMAIADGLVIKGEACHLRSEDAFGLLPPLQALIDQKMDELIDRHEKKSTLSQPSWATNCLQSCDCGVYASLLERRGFENLNEADQRVYRRVSSSTLEQTKDELRTCSTRSTWFCSSDLKSYLEQERDLNH